MNFLLPPENFPPCPLSLPQPGIILLSPQRQQVNDKATGTWWSNSVVRKTFLTRKKSAQTLIKWQNLRGHFLRGHLSNVGTWALDKDKTNPGLWARLPGLKWLFSSFSSLFKLTLSSDLKIPCRFLIQAKGIYLNAPWPQIHEGLCFWLLPNCKSHHSKSNLFLVLIPQHFPCVHLAANKLSSQQILKLKSKFSFKNNQEKQSTLGRFSKAQNPLRWLSPWEKNLMVHIFKWFNYKDGICIVTMQCI